MTKPVLLSPRAETQLAQLFRLIAEAASPATAKDYTGAILARCAGLGDFPKRGTPRDDLLKGLRTIVFRRRVTIAYIELEASIVVHGIFYAGQDLEQRFEQD